MKWDDYTSACDICGYRLEGYDKQDTLCGACLNDIENKATQKKEMI